MSLFARFRLLGYAILRCIFLTVFLLIFLVAFGAARYLAPVTSRAILVRWFLQSCGGAFVKLGQVLAMRYDLLPAEYCQELSKLLDRMPPVPAKRIIAAIEKDLGRPLNQVFQTFDRVPLASASVAQVHRAVLHEGDAVVVKVVKPGIRRQLDVDLGFAVVLARMLDRYRLLPYLGLSRIVADLVRLTREELDFRREARNAHILHRLLLQDEIDHYAPRIYAAYCGEMIITMEEIRGVSVIDMLDALDTRDEVRIREWRERGISIPRTARLLLRSILEQTIRHRMFQADPHAANLIVMEGGTLAWVDFGITGWLDEKTWSQQFRLRSAIAEGRLHDAYESFLDTLEPLPPVDLSQFEIEVKAVIRDWLLASSNPHSTLLEKSSGYFLIRIFGAIRRARAALPTNVMRLYRTMIIGDIIMLRLDPAIDWLPILRSFVEEETRRQVAAGIHQRLDVASMGAGLQALLRAPGAAVRLVDWLNRRLPDAGRSYQRRLSVLDRAVILSLSYLRALVGIFTLLLVVARVYSGFAGPDGVPHPAFQTVQLYWWPLVITGGVVVIVLGKLLRELEVVVDSGI